MTTATHKPRISNRLRQRVMLRAWELYRSGFSLSFANCLRRAWAMLKAAFTERYAPKRKPFLAAWDDAVSKSAAHKSPHARMFRSTGKRSSNRFRD